MRLKGIITRKENDTGVTLRAKIISPNGQISATKDFKVRALKNALSDLTCVIIDSATAEKKVNANNDFSDVKDDLKGLDYTGEHNTKIEYRVIDTVAPLLSTYLTSSGEVIGRPRFGEGDAQGYFEITVSKGKEFLTTRTPVTIKQYTADEVFTHESLNAASLWNTIKGANDIYMAGNEWSGNKNILYPLDMKSSITVNEIATAPINITWEVLDVMKNSSLFNDDNTVRIKEAEGTSINPLYEKTYTVDRPTYVEAIAASNSTSFKALTTFDKITGAKGNSISVSPENFCVRIHGLTLVARLSLAFDGVTYNAKNSITIPCATLSKYVTNAEVLETIASMLTCSILVNNTGIYQQKKISDGSIATPWTVVAPDTGGTADITCYKNALELDATNILGMGAGQIKITSIINDIWEFDGTSAKPSDYVAQVFPIAGSGGVVGGFSNGGTENQVVASLDFEEIATLAENDRKFSIHAEILVNNYSDDGITPIISGGQRTALFIPVVVDCASYLAALATSGSSSGSSSSSGTGTTTP